MHCLVKFKLKMNDMNLGYKMVANLVTLVNMKVLKIALESVSLTEKMVF